jgi:hypothetical protein
MPRYEKRFAGWDEVGKADLWGVWDCVQHYWVPVEVWPCPVSVGAGMATFLLEKGYLNGVLPPMNDKEVDALHTRLKFVECRDGEAFLQKLPRIIDRIGYFHETYENTDQNTALFAAEFFLVVRHLLRGERPVKLAYLTDFEGEEK